MSTLILAVVIDVVKFLILSWLVIVLTLTSLHASKPAKSLLFFFQQLAQKLSTLRENEIFVTVAF